MISLDVTATALAAAGVATDEASLDGVDLVPHLEGASKAAPHDELYWRFGRQMAIRRGDWKLVRPSLSTAEYADVSTEPLLFNLREDVDERNDLASTEPALVRELQASWEAWNAQLMQPRWPATLKGKVFPVRQ